MNFKQLVVHHKLFFYFVILFIIVGAVDILNLDRISYSAVCTFVAPISTSPCPPYYDLPIWQVYLSLAILAGLYHVHGEVRKTNHHLGSHK